MLGFCLSCFYFDGETLETRSVPTVTDSSAVTFCKCIGLRVEQEKVSVSQFLLGQPSPAVMRPLVESEIMRPRFQEGEMRFPLTDSRLLALRNGMSSYVSRSHSSFMRRDTA